MDNDGDLDAYFARFNAAPNEYWKNNGSGLFIAAGPATTQQQTDVQVGFADFDGDADLDLFRTAGPEHLRLNNGGVFTPRGQSIAGNLRSFGLGDLDGDGDIDALVGLSSRMSVWLNADAEISISIAGSPPDTSVALGASLQYEITVTNTAGSTVSGATVAAQLLGIADSFELTGIAATGGATSSLAPGPISSLMDTVGLPVGSSIVYSVAAVVADGGDPNLAPGILRGPRGIDHAAAGRTCFV